MIAISKYYIQSKKLFLVVLILFSFIGFSQNSIALQKDKKIINYLQKSDSCKVAFDYATSFEYISIVLTEAKHKKDTNTEILCYIKLVELYRHAEFFKKAERYLIKSDSLIKMNNNIVSDYNKMYFYNRKALLFSEYYQQPDSTLWYSKKALEIAQKSNNENFQFTSLMEIGYSYEQKNQFETALQYYQNAFALAKKKADISQSCDALVNSARVNRKMKKFDAALQICDEGLLLLANNSNYFQKLLFYDIKQNVYEKLNDKSAAFDNLKERLKYTDLYYEQKTKDKLIDKTTQFELEEQKQLLQKRKEEIDSVKKSQLLLMAVISLFVLGLLLLVYYSKKIKMINAQLNVYAKENAFLLNEANHRINNNLQLLIILLSEEINKKETSNYEKEAITKILTKVESISTLHRHLYQSKDKRNINLETYLNAIIENFDTILTENHINVHSKIEPIIMRIDVAMYLGLLITELLINSIKYAFNNQENKTITVNIFIKENKLNLDYTDNGKKITGQEVKPKLILKLCRQLKANYTISTEKGFKINIIKEIAIQNEH